MCSLQQNTRRLRLRASNADAEETQCNFLRFPYILKNEGLALSQPLVFW